jgi:lysophospholipase L1-like esterase
MRMVNTRRLISILPWLTLAAPMACSSGQQGNNTAPAGTGGNSTAASIPTSTGSGSGSGSGTGTGSGSGSTVVAPPNSSASGGSSSSSGVPAGTQAGVPCGGSLCALNACCQTGTSTPVCGAPTDDGGLGPGACAADQQQLCLTDDDCQQSATLQFCVNGFCAATAPEQGDASVGTVPPITDGGVGGGGTGVDFDGAPFTAPTDTGAIPTGYPAPTAANFAKCQTVTISSTACTGQDAGDTCIECLFGGSTYDNTVDPPGTATAVSEAGNYAVTVTIGGAAAGSTYVSTESERGLLAPVTTTAGQSLTYSFAVNVRSMEGQPNHAGGPGGYPGLDLFFSGPAATPPQVSAIGYSLLTATPPIVVYIASDSTACDQTGGAFGGWGQMLPEFFAPPVAVANYANSGASSADFIGNPDLWGGITSHWKAGDFVLIQFGHNDKTITDAQVETNLEKYVEQAKAAMVTPILVSPPARVQFGNGTTDGPQTSLHEASAAGAAMVENVGYVPLTDLSTAWYNTLGSQAAALKFHANDSDATHTNLVGAAKLASLVAGSIKAQNLPLAKYLR